jgi:hypothetical protein
MVVSSFIKSGIAAFFIGLALTACKNAESEALDLNIVNYSPYPVKSYPSIFESAFFKDAKANHDSIHFYTADIGKLDIETGNIIACDPIVMHDAKPFVQKFPLGRFPVQLAIAKIGDDERVAFSRILFSGEPVVKWEYALEGDEKQRPLNSDTFFGYPVDGGTGMFVDQKSSEEFNRRALADSRLWDKVFTGYTAPGRYWSYNLYHFGLHSLANFSTGYGDGTYATFVGYDSQNRICRLLTDFDLVDWRTD